MTIKEYESEQELDDAFEAEVDKQERIFSLRGSIEDAADYAERCYDDWIDAKEQLEELQMQLDELTQD